MRFKPGQKVVCTHRGTWSSITTITRTSIIGSGPKFNEICTIVGLVVIGGIPGYELVGYEYNQFTGRKMAFTTRWFEPLIDDSILEKELESIQIEELA